MRLFLSFLAWIAWLSFAGCPAADAAPKKAGSGLRAHPRRATPAGYQSHVRRWHERDPGAAAPRDQRGRDKLVLEAINLGERVELEATSERGEFSEVERSKAAHLLRDGRHDGDGPLDPALLDLLYDLQRHFGAPCIRVVSAYRSGSGSEHGRGRAADIVVPGVPDRDLAAYARTVAGTGVGLYPASGFVHVDVRGRSHYWVDTSGPGQRPHVVGKKKLRKKPIKPRGAATRGATRGANGRARP